MFSILTNLGPEVPIALFLMGIMGLRSKVWPKASVLINARPEKIFELIDVQDGKREDWGQTKTLTELVDVQRQHFRKTYTTTLTSGEPRSSSAMFSVRQRQPNAHLEIQREGLEGRSLNNELLSQYYDLTPEGEATRLTMTYEWGPRPLLAQLMARADLWGGAFRLKSMAENGTANNKPFQWITAGVAALTGLLSLIAFATFLGWSAAALLIVALFVHEFGHLLAYRMIGQPWGRMVFLPFVGAMAIPRMNYDSQGQVVFAALMGPGFSTLLALACAVQLTFAEQINGYIALLGLITIALNLFNLLPVEPLDGGIALRSVLNKVLGQRARFGLIGIGVAILGVGIAFSQLVLMIFGGLAIALNFNKRKIDAGLTPMPRWHVGVSLLSYVGLIVGYLALLFPFQDREVILEAVKSITNLG